MRIFAGELGGRQIKSPPGLATRPMLDRVREALFNTLAFEVPDARVLDLFSGTGSLGLEALSRGAAEAFFIEQDRRTARLLSANVETLGVGDRARVLTGDALASDLWGAEPWDLVLLDPPYPMVKDAEGLERVYEALERLATGALAPDGVAVLHAPRGLLRPSQIPSGFASRLREYGNQALWYLRHAADAEAPAEPREESKP